MKVDKLLPQPVDVTIVGGGFVGYLAAIACARMGFTVVILEAKTHAPDALAKTEGRAIALAHTSCTLLKSLGVWPSIQQQAFAIEQVHISQQGSFGKCRINASDHKLSALGHVVPATQLAYQLAKIIATDKNIHLIAPAKVTALDNGTVEYCENDIPKTIQSKLVLACDGTQSFVREYFNISTTAKEYGQHAIVANVSMSQAHQQCAKQRFTEMGVLAMLPLHDNRMTSVLTLDEKTYDALMQQDDAAYLSTLQSLLGMRGGVLSDLGKRFTYPLTWVQADKVVAARTLLLGNAAHTISPVAAQGLNLALRDLSVLFDCLHSACEQGEDIGSHQLLNDYAEQVEHAQQPILHFTDRLMKFVKPRWLKPARGLGLSFLDLCVPLKQPLAKHLMGISKHSGRLMREGCDDI